MKCHRDWLISDQWLDKVLGQKHLYCWHFEIHGLWQLPILLVKLLQDSFPSVMDDFWNSFIQEFWRNFKSSGWLGLHSIKYFQLRLLLNNPCYQKVKHLWYFVTAWLNLMFDLLHSKYFGKHTCWRRHKCKTLSLTYKLQLNTLSSSATSCFACLSLSRKYCFNPFFSGEVNKDRKDDKFTIHISLYLFFLHKLNLNIFFVFNW